MRAVIIFSDTAAIVNNDLTFSTEVGCVELSNVNILR